MQATLAADLQESGIVLPCGPFAVRLRSDIPQVAAGIHALYADFPRLDERQFVDFDIAIRHPSPLRRLLKPQVSFFCDGRTPFRPLPASQAFSMMEWGLNWVISSHAHDHLVLHAAAVERDGRVLLLAADPGSGKSTLCAALVQAGWRLLSDELALLRLSDGLVQPIARPISLKNRSIDILRERAPEAMLGPVSHDTAKGDVAHMRPPEASVRARNRLAPPAVLVFPRWGEGASLQCTPRGKAEAFAELVRHAFNLPLLADDGFDAIGDLLDRVQAWNLSYGSLETALPAVERLWEGASEPPGRSQGEWSRSAQRGG